MKHLRCTDHNNSTTTPGNVRCQPKEKNKYTLQLLLVTLAVVSVIVIGILATDTEHNSDPWKQEEISESIHQLRESDKVDVEKVNIEYPVIEKRKKTVWATVTAYNTVSGQTDSTPCIAAGGYICGRADVVACPRIYPLGTWVEIQGRAYECMDRTASKYNGRFDISFDKDVNSALVFGKQYLEVTIL